MGFIINFIDSVKSGKEANKYRRMSVSRLLELGDYELLDAVNELLYFYSDENDIPKQNREQITVLSVINFHNEIQNGGLCQFFVNSSSAYAPFVPGSLEAVSAFEIKDLFDKFVSENHINLGDSSGFKIEDVEEFEEKNAQYPFDEFDAKFYELCEKEPLLDLVTEYVRKNAEQVFAGLTAN